MTKDNHALSWALALGLCGLGVGGCVWLLLNWRKFLFGYHSVGLNLWSYVLVFSLLCLYIGLVGLWSTVKTRRNIR